MSRRARVSGQHLNDMVAFCKLHFTNKIPVHRPRRPFQSGREPFCLRTEWPSHLHMTDNHGYWHTYTAVRGHVFTHPTHTSIPCKHELFSPWHAMHAACACWPASGYIYAPMQSCSCHGQLTCERTWPEKLSCLTVPCRHLPGTNCGLACSPDLQPDLQPEGTY